MTTATATPLAPVRCTAEQATVIEQAITALSSKVAKTVCYTINVWLSIANGDPEGWAAHRDAARTDTERAYCERQRVDSVARIELWRSTLALMRTVNQGAIPRPVVTAEPAQATA